MTPETPPLPDMRALEHLRGKRIAVTGGTGFLGRHLLPLLTAAGADITCLVRATSRRDGLPDGIRTAQVDLSRGDGLVEALRGQDVLIHMAALLFGLGWQDYLRANSTAARQLADALTRLRAEGQPLPRVVLVSSLAASGPCAVAPGRGDDSPGAALLAVLYKGIKIINDVPSWRSKGKFSCWAMPSACSTGRRCRVCTTMQENINNSLWNYGAALSLIMLFLIAATSLFSSEERESDKGGSGVW